VSVWVDVSCREKFVEKKTVFKLRTPQKPSNQNPTAAGGSRMRFILKPWWIWQFFDPAGGYFSAITTSRFITRNDFLDPGKNQAVYGGF